MGRIYRIRNTAVVEREDNGKLLDFSRFDHICKGGIAMSQKSLLRIFCILFSVSCFLTFASCKKEETKAPAEKVVNVQTRTAEKKSLQPFVDTIGTLNPFEEVTVSSEIDGILKEIHADNGSKVSKGRLLARIDDVDFLLEVRRAEAAVKQTEATLSNTKLEHQRKEALFKEQLVTQQQFEDVATRLALADAEVDRAKASLSLAKEKLSRTRILSPLAGEVKEKKVERGNFVKNGTPLFSIIRSNPVKLNFTLAEKDVVKIRIGQEAVFTVEALPGKEFKGKVTVIYPNIEEKTRTLLAEAQVPNPSGMLKPGFFAHVTLYTGPPRDTVLIPVIAPLYERDSVRIFVVEGDRARARNVKLGQKTGDMVEVVEGLSEGETVVTVGQQNLSDNTKVKIQSIVGSQE
ncbi:MAG: efflux RND transporter periplasmic adaptor subunit [Nitrospirota bacterium]